MRVLFLASRQLAHSASDRRGRRPRTQCLFLRGPAHRMKPLSVGLPLAPIALISRQYHAGDRVELERVNLGDTIPSTTMSYGV